MLATLPFVLLLLDYWPLNRMAMVANPRLKVPVPRRLILEKLPLFGLAAASGVVTIFAQTDAIPSFEHISLPLRLGNAVIAYAAYLGQMFWPSGLAIFYPFSVEKITTSSVGLSLAVLVGISTGVSVLRRRRYFLAGWLWYLIMLVPVIGILQVGSQARADRYTYLPQIGLYVTLTWAAADLSAGWRYRRWLLGGLATVILVALVLCARVQTAYWRNSESLWTHALACAPDNYISRAKLGDALRQKGNVAEAIVQYQIAIQTTHNNAEAHINLGNVLFENGRLNQAIIHYQKALEIKPDSAEACHDLGNALLQKGNVDEAIVLFQKALQIKPKNAEAHNALGNALLQKGLFDEAITQYQKALEIRPDYAESQGNLAWILATAPQTSMRNGNKAVELAQRANQLTRNENPVILDILATAYAEAGQFSEAVITAQHALQLAPANTATADTIRSQLKLFQAGSPFHYPELAP